MHKVEDIGRPGGHIGATRDTEAPRRLLTLHEASRLTNIAIHELKRAICAGRLRAVWQGRYDIRWADLDEFMHGL